MSTIADVQKLAWEAVNPLIPVNPDAAFYKEWLARKVGYTGPLGVPVSDEITLDDGTPAQPFSSGVVLHWAGSVVEAL